MRTPAFASMLSMASPVHTCKCLGSFIHLGSLRGERKIFGSCSKWFLDKCGHEGLNKMLDGFEDRTAYALCTFGYTGGPDEEPILFEGRTDVRTPSLLLLASSNTFPPPCFAGRDCEAQRPAKLWVGSYLPTQRIQGDLRRDGQGCQEQHLTPRQGSGEAQGPLCLWQ